MEQEPSQIELLLARFIAGETTASENDQIRQWAAESPENQAELAAMQEAWAQMDAVDPLYLNRTDAAWDRFQQNVVQAQPLAAVTPLRSRFPRFGVAAAALVLLFLSSIWLLNRPGAAVPVQIVSHEANGVRELALKDGSELSLKTHAKLVIPDTFIGEERKVELVAGQAYFEIARDTSHPFVVAVRELEVAVLGTEFDVKLDEESGDVRVNVTEGRVALRIDQQELVLVAGETGFYEAETGNLHKEVLVNPNQVAWKTRKLIFQRSRLAEVSRTLTEVYDREIVFENESLLDCTWTVNFEGASLEEILLVLTQTMNWEISSQTDTITIKGANCR